MTLPSAPQRFLILGNGQKKGVAQYAETLRSLLEKAACAVVGFDLTGEQSLVDHGADLAFVLGGDGAILRAACQMGTRQVPVLGINLGRLGFLAELGPEDLQSAVAKVVSGQFDVTTHVVLDCQVHNGGQPRVFRALNEVVVSSLPPFRLTDIELTVDGESAATFSGDGLIVSTPIGSTAHSLAAGGPILMQTLPAVVITPICPHALTWRPLVESADRVFELRVVSAGEGATLIVDGHIQVSLSTDEVVRLSRAPVNFQLARLRGRGYYGVLTEKLHWGDRVGQRRPPPPNRTDM